MPDALPSYAIVPVLIRTPANAGFIARRVLSIDWPRWTGQPTPPTHSQAWLLEACRAELAWSRADYCRITGAADASHHDGYDGAHPSEAHRLPVEQVAAGVLNNYGHVHPNAGSIRETIRVLRSARRKAVDQTQSDAYRASWAHVATYTANDLRTLWSWRRKMLPYFVSAARAYRRERAAVDATAMARAA